MHHQRQGAYAHKSALESAENYRVKLKIVLADRNSDDPLENHAKVFISVQSRGVTTTIKKILKEDRQLSQ